MTQHNPRTLLLLKIAKGGTGCEKLKDISGLCSIVSLDLEGQKNGAEEAGRLVQELRDPGLMTSTTQVSEPWIQFHWS